MPDPDEIQRIERAQKLELERIERAQKLAVDQAVRDALVDRTLEEHSRHLEQINGSQRDMADSLDALEKLFAELTVSSTAVAKYVGEQSTGRLSKRQLWVGGVAAVATWAAMIASLLTSIH